MFLSILVTSPEPSCQYKKFSCHEFFRSISQEFLFNNFWIIRNTKVLLKYKPVYVQCANFSGHLILFEFRLAIWKCWNMDLLMFYIKFTPLKLCIINFWNWFLITRHFFKKIVSIGNRWTSHWYWGSRMSRYVRKNN